MPRTLKTRSDLRSFIPPGWNQTLRRSSQALLIHPTPYLPIMFTIAPCNRFRDSALQRRRRGLILPGLVFTLSGATALSSWGYSWCHLGMAGRDPSSSEWCQRRALLMTPGGKLILLIIDPPQACQWVLWDSRRWTEGGGKKKKKVN